MFSEEVARNPDLAHLARGRRTSASAATTSRGRSAAGPPPPPDMDQVVKALGNLGNNAKRQFQSLAAQFNAKMKAAQHHAQNLATGGNNNLNTNTSPASPAAHERRGLLDDNDEGEEMAFEFASRKDL